MAAACNNRGEIAKLLIENKANMELSVQVSMVA